MFLVLIVNSTCNCGVSFDYNTENGVFYDYNSDEQWFCDLHYWWTYITLVKYIPTYLLPTYLIYGFKAKQLIRFVSKGDKVGR
jgi:hypothetical protein